MNKFEDYIEKNRDIVNEYLLKLGYIYALECINSGEESALDHKYLTDRVVYDGRRRNKAIDILKYLNVIKGPSSSDYKLFCISKESVKNLKKLLEPLAKRHKFKFDDKFSGTNRELGYTVFNRLDMRAVAHYVIHPEQYLVSINEECPYYGYTARPVIRLFPKSLEQKAEREVFKSNLIAYYDTYIPDAIKIMYGVDTKALTCTYRRDLNLSANSNLDRYEDIDLDLHKIHLTDLNKKNMKSKLSEAKLLKKYLEDLIDDLEELIPKVSNREKFDFKKFCEVAEKNIEYRIPLMLNSDTEIDRNLSELYLRGSNKGLI